MRHTRRVAAFTRRDLIVVIAVVFVLVLILIPALFRARQKSRSICCNCNLKQIGLAYRIWADDHGNRDPAFVPVTNGGWSDLLRCTNASSYCWTNYSTMANELVTPFILVCPTDERTPAASFSNFMDNSNLSYFVGVISNSEANPQLLLGGDRNLGPGRTPDAGYGYSPTNGRGNDVIISGPICWSSMMHLRRNPAGCGNILLGDGSAQQVTSSGLNHVWMNSVLAMQADENPATNFPGMRFIFP